MWVASAGPLELVTHINLGIEVVTQPPQDMAEPPPGAPGRARQGHRSTAAGCESRRVERTLALTSRELTGPPLRNCVSRAGHDLVKAGYLWSVRASFSHIAQIAGAFR